MINGSNYRAELHTTPIEGKMTLEPISDQAIWMFNHDYLAVDVVNTTVSHIGDQTLEVEIMQHHSTLAHLDVNREQQKCLRLEQEQLELELGMCGHCLQDAQACNQVLDDMVSDQHICREQHQGCGCGCPAWKGDVVTDHF